MVDYIVDTRWDEENLSNLAGLIRRETGIAGFWKFNIVKFIEEKLPQLNLKGRTYKPELKFLEEDDTEEAYVSFTPKLILAVKNSIWDAAKRGDARARYILAHELGHLFLHKANLKPFSIASSLIQKYYREHSAEWQANTFAKHFLMPDNILFQFQTRSAQNLADECEIPLQLAEQRKAELQELVSREARMQFSKLIEQNFDEKSICRRCGSCAVPEQPPNSPCEECGALHETTDEELFR